MEGYHLRHLPEYARKSNNPLSQAACELFRQIEALGHFFSSLAYRATGIAFQKIPKVGYHINHIDHLFVSYVSS